MTSFGGYHARASIPAEAQGRRDIPTINKGKPQDTIDTGKMQAILDGIAVKYPGIDIPELSRELEPFTLGNLAERVEGLKSSTSVLIMQAILDTPELENNLYKKHVAEVLSDPDRPLSKFGDPIKREKLDHIEGPDNGMSERSIRELFRVMNDPKSRFRRLAEIKRERF